MITASIPASPNRDEAEGDVNATPVVIAAIREAANLALEGKYQSARIALVSAQRLLQRTMKTAAHQRDYCSFIVLAERLDSFMRAYQAREAALCPSGAAPSASATRREDSDSQSIFELRSASKQTLERCLAVLSLVKTKK